MIDVEKVIREYIPEVIHLSLGTSRNNVPWVCEVHFAYDDELNLYFISSTDTRHSTELRENPQVAGNIVVQHQPGEKPRGVYFEGTAEELTGVTKDDAAYKAYEGRFGDHVNLVDETGDPDGPRFYRIAVDTFYVFDTRESTPPQKHVLPWKAR